MSDQVERECKFFKISEGLSYRIEPPTQEERVRRSRENKPIMCGGCGADRPSMRCIGCEHDFGGLGWCGSAFDEDVSKA